MNIYLSFIHLISLDNKYSKWYFKLCESRYNRARNKDDANNIVGYTEGHHILPKSFKLGGRYDSDNFVYFTAKEHFIAHWLLSKMFKKDMWIGTTRSEEDRRKISEGQMGRVWTQASKDKISKNSNR